MKEQINEIVMVQPAGIGDILITQKIAHKLYEVHNVPIIWPVFDHLHYIKDYLEGPVEFVKWGDGVWNRHDLSALRVPEVRNGTLFVPIWRAYDGGPSILKVKYKMVGLELDGWQEYVKIRRNGTKEAELYQKVVTNPEYVYVNSMFATPPGQLISQYVPVIFEKPVVNLRLIDGYTPFDWLAVIENAQAVHMVSSCHLFMIESLPGFENNLHVYNRQSPEDYKELSLLQLRKKWNIIH